MPRSKQRKHGRIRGVRASHDKVIQAMVSAGVPSQKALACDIARREGLTNPPTAMVSRVFNEEKVDPLQLARVALALSVPVQSLYHDRQESEDAPPVAGKSRRPLLIAALASGALLLTVSSVAIWYVGASRRDGAGGSIVATEAMRDFRQAQTFLDSSPNELNLRRAQSHLEAALRREPTFVPAAAQLCETLVRQSWAHDEEGTLRDAQAVCDRARAMDAEATTTKIAYAHLLLRTGRVADSASMLEELLVEEPHHRDALLLASEAGIDRFLKTGDREYAGLAERHARLAVEAAPKFWKTHWQLGRARFELGKLPDALRSYKEAARLDPNEYVLGNLGSISFCSGDVQGAYDAYMQARRVTGNPQLGEEYMGLFYYYLGAFERSLDSRRRAIAPYDSETGPEIHQIWGDLGDSYRRTRQPAAAIDAYTRAVRIVEQDIAKGNATAGDKAFRAYYRIAAGQSGAPLPDKIELRNDLEQAAAVTEPGALVRIAIAWRLLGETDRSQQAAQRASAKCPVYRRHPDLRS